MTVLTIFTMERCPGFPYMEVGQTKEERSEQEACASPRLVGKDGLGVDAGKLMRLGMPGMHATCEDSRSTEMPGM